MARRYLFPAERSIDCDFKVMEVVSAPERVEESEGTKIQFLLVDSHWETLLDVQENMDDFVRNLIKVNRMNEKDRKKIEENARLFEDNLESLFKMISSTNRSNVMENLSHSLKKALLLMALERYDDDLEAVCKSLGLTHAQLDEELNRYGLNMFDKAA
ncbi:MAG: hypothetical protein HYS23_00275 [Geobacter sp.]|nr:hypothetical protein [Geobacter sp.]